MSPVCCGGFMRVWFAVVMTLTLTASCKKDSAAVDAAAAESEAPPAASLQDAETDPMFAVVAAKLKDADRKGASAAWDKADAKKAGPAWKLEYYLGRISALEEACKDVLEAYANALRAAEKLPEPERAATREKLTSDSLLISDVVACLDDDVATKALAFVEGRLGRAAVPTLLRYVKNPAPSVDARWDALLLLDRLYANTLPARPTLLSLLKGQGSCKARLSVLKRLATGADADTLADLRRARAELADNAKAKCVVKALDDLSAGGGETPAK